MGGGGGSGKQSLLSIGGFKNREYINRSIPLVLWHSEISVSTACRTKVMKSVFSQHFLFLRNTCRKFRSLSRRLGASTSLHWGRICTVLDVICWKYFSWLLKENYMIMLKVKMNWINQKQCHLLTKLQLSGFLAWWSCALSLLLLGKPFHPAQLPLSLCRRWNLRKMWRSFWYSNIITF